MTILPITTYPDPLLLKKARAIENPKDPAIQELILDMFETMEKNNGIGLAAPQVGKSLRLCVIKLEGKSYVLINPVFKSKSWKKTVAEEGCLSLPGQFMQVKRSQKVKVKALDRKGKEVVIQAQDMLARAFQHEIDHLNGTLIIEKRVKEKIKK